MKDFKKITDIVFNNTYEFGSITILECLEANARQYEVKLQNDNNKPEWFYINLYENTICTIDIKTRERGPLFDIK